MSVGMTEGAGPVGIGAQAKKEHSIIHGGRLCIGRTVLIPPSTPFPTRRKLCKLFPLLPNELHTKPANHCTPGRYGKEGTFSVQPLTARHYI